MTLGLGAYLALAFVLGYNRARIRARARCAWDGHVWTNAVIARVPKFEHPAGGRIIRITYSCRRCGRERDAAIEH